LKKVFLKKLYKGYLKKGLYIIAIFNNICYLSLAKEIYVGKIIKAKGRVVILKKNSFRPVSYKKYKGKLYVKDIVRTKRRSYADIKFIDTTQVHLSPESRLIIEDYRPQSKFLYATYGKVIYKVAKQNKALFKIKTPTALIGVKGTQLLTYVKDGFSIIAVKEGLVEVYNPKIPNVKVLLKPKTLTVVKKDLPPTKPIKLDEKKLEKLFKVSLQTEKKGKISAKGKSKTLKVKTSKSKISSLTSSKTYGYVSSSSYTKVSTIGNPSEADINTLDKSSESIVTEVLTETEIKTPEIPQEISQTPSENTNAETENSQDNTENLNVVEENVNVLTENSQENNENTNSEGSSENSENNLETSQNNEENSENVENSENEESTGNNQEFENTLTEAETEDTITYIGGEEGSSETSYEDTYNAYYKFYSATGKLNGNTLSLTIPIYNIFSSSSSSSSSSSGSSSEEVTIDNIETTLSISSPSSGTSSNPVSLQIHIPNVQVPE